MGMHWVKVSCEFAQGRGAWAENFIGEADSTRPVLMASLVQLNKLHEGATLALSDYMAIF